MAERAPAKPSAAPPDDVLIRGFCASVSSFMAARGISNAEDAIDRFLMEARRHYSWESFMGRQDFDQFMLDRAANKAKRYNLPFPGYSDRAQEELEAAAAAHYRDESRR